MFNYLTLPPEECEFIEVASTSDLQENDRLFVELDDIRIVLFNIAGGLFAIGDLCSHDEGPLGDGELDQYEIICPRHGARFDVRNGKAVMLPAIVDIPAYPVKVVNGKIQVGLPKDR